MRLLTFILVMNTLTCVGQDFFADNLRNFPWTADESFNIEKLKKSKAVELSILGMTKDSLKIDRTIWTFGDSLTIGRYDVTRREEKLLGKFQYDLHWDRLLLNIRIDDTETLTYRLTFVSTGSFLLLTRKKLKNNKGRQKL